MKGSLILSLAAGLSAATADARTDWGFSILTPPGRGSAQAFGLAPGGSVVVGGLGPIGSPHAGVWTSLDPGSAIDLNPAGAAQSSLVASTGTQHVGSAWFGSSQRAGVWSGDSASSFVSLDPGGYEYTVATGTDGVHQIGTGRTTGGQYRALRWTGNAGSVTVLNPPTSVGAGAHAEAAGRQVGWAFFPPTYTERFAGFWSGSAASWTLLGAPAGFGDSEATDLSPDGQTQVGWAVGATGINWAAMWHSTPGSFVSLHPTGRLGSSILATDGEHEVGWTIPGLGTGMRAAFWQGSSASFVDLSATLPGTYTISEATSVSSTITDIWVSGYAYMPSNNQWDAVVWHRSIPAPSAALAVLMMGGAWSGGRRRRV